MIKWKKKLKLLIIKIMIKIKEIHIFIIQRLKNSKMLMKIIYIQKLIIIMLKEIKKKNQREKKIIKILLMLGIL